jgi:GDP-mannose 6-dehydrogenase
MNVSVLGLGSVGAVSALCLTRDGHNVIGCDIDSAKLELLRVGRSPIVEPGIEALASAAWHSGRLRLTENAAEAVAASEVSLVCVGTPTLAGGSQDLTALLLLFAEIAPALRESRGHLVAVRSTVLPGTIEMIIKPMLAERSGAECGGAFHIAFLPEFLREGSSIEDYSHPPFTVVGVDDPRAAAPVRELYGHLPADFHITSIRTAELLKYACNAFHALKVTFANEVGRLAPAVGADGHEVMRLLCLDRQLNISPAYLRPGFAFGGPCLPKDVEALIHLAAEKGIAAPVLGAILPSNDQQIDVTLTAILANRPRTVGLLGLTFKAGTDDVRSSPLLELTRRLIDRGVTVKAYDPDLKPGDLIGANLRFALSVLPDLRDILCENPSELIRTCDVLVIGHDDERIARALKAHCRESHTLIDLVGLDETRRIRGKQLKPDGAGGRG